ncbi:Uncharacterized protein APZ42_024598, partial [Daphnia magna]
MESNATIRMNEDLLDTNHNSIAISSQLISLGGKLVASEDCASSGYGSESTEKMGKLLNEVFDVFDGRYINKRIKFNNWTKKILDAMMHILNVTFRLFSEKEKYPNSPSESFMSQTTLLSFMMNVRSTIALTKECVNARYITVLSGNGFSVLSVHSTIIQPVTLSCRFFSSCIKEGLR